MAIVEWSLGRGGLGVRRHWARLGILSLYCRVGLGLRSSSNLTVILFGAGLSALLVYALTFELFSENSPIMLHNNACKRIKPSSQASREEHIAEYVYRRLLGCTNRGTRNVKNMETMSRNYDWAR